MQLSDHNGWENKFTWVVHLHLSNEQGLMQEVTDLVAEVLDEKVAGWRLEMWLKMALENWLTGFCGRTWAHDEAMHLLVWDVVGSALAYTDWDILVRLLVGEAVTTENLFTSTLYQSIMSYAEWQHLFSVLLPVTPSVSVCADVLKDSLRQMFDAWMEVPSPSLQRGSSVGVLVSGLLATTYEVICWHHIARAFRPGH